MAVASDFVLFIYSSDLERSHRFYTGVLGLPMTTDQGVCRIYRVRDGAFIGVCSHREPSPDGTIITLVSDDVDGWYDTIRARGGSVERAPAHNPRFGITHFFVKAPDGYLVEIQSFDDPDWRSPVVGSPATPPAPERPDQ